MRAVLGGLSEGGARMKYGYARVSTDGQRVTAQVEQLTETGAGKVFKEKPAARLQTASSSSGRSIPWKKATC